jgi:hypothetical protein
MAPPAAAVVLRIVRGPAESGAFGGVDQHRLLREGLRQLRARIEDLEEPDLGPAELIVRESENLRTAQPTGGDLRLPVQDDLLLRLHPGRVRSTADT